MELPKEKVVSVEEYLRIERTSGVKHEYINGRVYAMAGGTLVHGMICTKVTTVLDRKTEGKDCEVLGSEVKVFIQRDNKYYYPDASVVCGDIETPDNPSGAVTNPVVVVEVVSPSSERMDQKYKFFDYRLLPSLRNYLVVYQDKPRVQVCYRPLEADVWRIDDYEGYDTEFEIQSLEIKLSVGDFYTSVRKMIDK